MIYKEDVAEFKCWIKLYEKKIKIKYITVNTNLSKSFNVI